MSKIVGKMAGCYSPLGRTMILQDENGNKLSTGVVVEQEQIFDANISDVRIGKTFVSDEGILTGKNTITYRTIKRECLILPNESFSILLSDYDCYNYTKFQGIVTKFNTSVSDSVQAEKVILNDAVFNVNSAEKISDVIKNDISKSIDFNIVNDTDDTYLIHFFMYKEEI